MTVEVKPAGEDATPDKHSAEHHDVLNAMEDWGGSFVSLLARAWRAADAENHRRMYATFGEYYRQYRDQHCNATRTLALRAAKAAGESNQGIEGVAKAAAGCRCGICHPNTLTPADLDRISTLGGEG